MEILRRPRVFVCQGKSLTTVHANLGLTHTALLFSCLLHLQVPPLYPSTYANWPHNATTRHLLVQPPVELSRYLSRTFQIDLLRRRAAVSVSFLSGFFHEINPGLMASRYACRACLPPPGQPVSVPSPVLCP